MNEQAHRPAPSGPGAAAYFDASRVKVIGLLLAGVLLVGALGGIAGIAFDPEPLGQQEPAVAPVGQPELGAGERKGFRAPAGAAEAFLAPAAPQGKGKFLQLQTGVQFWLAKGWRVLDASDATAYLSDGKGGYMFVATAKLGPKVPAAQVLSKNLKSLLPKANYTQLQVSGPKAWAGAYGNVVSSAYLEYISLYVDNQGSAPIYGQLYGAVRNDGMALVLLIENIPPDGWEKKAGTMSDIVLNSYGRFGGVV